MADYSFVEETSYSYDYFSGANIGLFIGSRLLTEIVGVEFQLLQLKRPIYGYASSLYDAVAPGIVQVSGVLHMNFLDGARLPTLIDMAQRGSGGESYVSVLNDKDQIAQVTERIDPNSTMPGLNKEVRALLVERYWSTPDTTVVPTAFKRPDEHSQSFVIRVQYGPPPDLGAEANRTSLELAGVHITGSAQTVGVGGEPIIESYPFIAREIR